MSALPPITDIYQRGLHVCLVPVHARWSPVFCGRICPGRLKGLEAYTTVSLALAAMLASSSSLMSTALRKLVASLVLNCGGLP